ncbi:TRAP transporter small permease [Suttonella ornithocola]|uniref:TRAP transporter small permease protein n=1 Tax=Suttonella ornithocola TaxID=279832 RepID=A0A380MMI6_9GAMM|nr:TRAP transporter small permease subunit [Suttonella ornithocola]SUO93845.1 TRAP-type C4-dicarboxylate transport system, small permease component [Suttonella ornithocola]
MKLLRHFWQDIEAWLCILIFIGITALGFINVCVRYLTSYAFASTEELLLQGFLLLTIFGAALAARRREHLAVTFFSDFLSIKWLQIVRVFSALVSPSYYLPPLGIVEKWR